MAQKIPIAFNLAHQVYELKITEQCAITQKVVSVKCKFCDVCGSEVIVIDGCIYMDVSIDIIIILYTK